MTCYRIFNLIRHCICFEILSYPPQSMAPSIFDPLRNFLSSGDTAGAQTEATNLVKSIPSVCQESSEYMSLVARLCAQTRQWGVAQLVSFRSLLLDNFKLAESKHWALTLFAFTAGYDLICRVYPETHHGYKPRMFEKITTVCEWFDDAVAMDTESRKIGKEYKLDWLMLVSGYCMLPPKLQSFVCSEIQTLEKVKRGCSQSVPRRIVDLGAVTEHEWVLQIDASEIGNEARYANHADNPNAILVKRMSNGRLLPHIVALRDINPEDEITINYGSSYWAITAPGKDPLLVGQHVKEPFTDCIYFNGVVEDFQCSPCPGGFLIPPHAGEKRKRRTDLHVKQVPLEHPAYPGFGLYATQPFKKFDLVCIYAGIIDVSPFSGRHASKYTVDLTSDIAIGPF